MYLHKSPLKVARLQMYSLFFFKCCWIIWSVLVQYCVFIPRCNHGRSSRQTSGNTISCLLALLSQENECSIRCLWFTIKKDKTVIGTACTQKRAHTHTPATRWLCLIVRLPRLCSRPLLLPPLFTDSRCILSLSTHASLRSHTAASPVKRRDRCEWTGPSSVRRW